MKNLKLENFGVQELDAKEMVQTDGGGYGSGAPRIVITAEYWYGPTSGTGFTSDRPADWVDFYFVEGSYY